MKEFFAEMLKIVDNKEKNEKIKELSFNSSIYILHAVEARKLDDKEFKHRFEEFKRKYNKMDMSEEYYISFLKSFRENPWISIAEEHLAYFLSKEEAIWACENNLGGMDDGGVFNYAVIEAIPLNRAYPTTCDGTQYDLYKFNYAQSVYEQIDWKTDEITKSIRKYFDLLYYDDESN